jgi:hypothetical protein
MEDFKERFRLVLQQYATLPIEEPKKLGPLARRLLAQEAETFVGELQEELLDYISFIKDIPSEYVEGN